MSLDGYLTLDEVGDRFGVLASTVRRWILDGKLPAVRTPSGRILVYEADIPLALEAVVPPPRVLDEQHEDSQ